MEDKLGDLRALVAQRNPPCAVMMVQGPSAVLDRLQLSPAAPRPPAFPVAPDSADHGDAGERVHAEEFMGDFLTKMDALKDGITNVRTTIRRIRGLKQQAIQATSPEQEKHISSGLSELVDTTNRDILNIKRGLESLKVENAAFAAKKPNSSEAKMRENMHAAITRKFRDILKDYQTIQTDYKKEVREKVSRQVHMVLPEASEEEVTKIVNSGDMSAATAVRMRITGQAHESLTNALSDLQDKYKDIRLLEQSVTELHQMFLDLATLVGAQGELLDQIEYSVNSAKDYTEKGEKELVSAREGQRRAKKRMCCISVCLVTVTIVVILGLVIGLTK